MRGIKDVCAAESRQETVLAAVTTGRAHRQGSVGNPPLQLQLVW